MPSAWVAGRFVATEHAISALDPTFQSGFGVFETLGAVALRLPLWEQHVTRLARGARLLGLPLPDFAPARVAASELLERNAHAGQIVRMTLGPGGLCITTRERGSRAPVRLVRAEIAREGADPLATIKCTSRAYYELVRARAQAAGADDAVVVDRADHVLETTVGNLLWTAEGEWRTPAVNGAFLPGIARAVLLAGLAARGLPVREVRATFAGLGAADAIFVTNAVHGARPATLAGGPAPESDQILDEIWTRALD